MVEAKNFVEKELGKNLDETQPAETTPETKEQIPIYTPPPPQMQENAPTIPEIPTQQQPIVQIVEKVVYKKRRIHGFFRTLTIIALLAIGFLMLGESTGIISLSINNFQLHQIFPITIILSTIIIRSYRGFFGKIFGLIIFLAIWGGMFTISVYTSLNPSSKWKEGNTINLNMPTAEKTAKTNLYIKTLIGNSYIEGSKQAETLSGIRKSDRNLMITSGNSTKEVYLDLEEEHNRNLLQKYNSNIDLTVSKNLPLDMLYIKNFLGLHTIDLTAIQRKILKFHAGIDDITIRVGNVLSGNKIEIQGALANVEMDIPNDVGVMMYYKHLVGIVDIPGFDALSGHYFQSQNISGAKSILNIFINLGAGNTKINRIKPK